MYASQLWSPNLRYKVNELEAVQRWLRPTKRIVGIRDKSYGDRLQRCDLLSLKTRRIKVGMHTVFKLIHGLNGITLEDAGLSLWNSLRMEVGCVLRRVM